LKAAKVLPRRRIWRPAEEGREVPHVPNVVPLGASVNRRAVMSSIMRWRNGLMGLSGIEGSCLAWG